MGCKSLRCNCSMIKNCEFDLPLNTVSHSHMVFLGPTALKRLFHTSPSILLITLDDTELLAPRPPGMKT